MNAGSFICLCKIGRMIFEITYSYSNRNYYIGLGTCVRVINKGGVQNYRSMKFSIENKGIGGKREVYVVKGLGGISWWLGLILFGCVDSVEAFSNQKITWDESRSLVYRADLFPDRVLGVASGGLFDSSAGSLLLSDARRSSCLFAWDLNDVLLEMDWPLMLLGKFLKFIVSHGLIYTIIVVSDYYRSYHVAKQLKLSARAADKNSLLLHRAYRLVAQETFPDNQQEAQALVSRLEWLYPEMYHLDHGVAAIVQALEKKGVQNVVCTNMGDSWLAKQIQTFEEAEHGSRTVQEIKDYEWAIGFLKKEHNFTPSVATSWIGKPDPKAYQLLLAKNPGSYGLRIFVDDQKANVEAAVQNGFDLGIVFKNAQSLKATLRDLGFLLKL